MIEASNSHHECAQTTTFGSEEVVEVIFCEPSLEDPSGERFDQFGGDLNLDKLLDHADTFIEPSLEDPSGERFDQFGGDLDLDKLFDHADTFSEPILEDPSGERFDQIECNLDLDKFLKQAMMFREPSLEDPLDESFAQFEFDLDLDMVHEQAKALLDPAPKMWIEIGDEEMVEQIEPPPISNWSNDKEVSTEAHSFITIPLETQYEPQASSFQCLKEPSYVEIFKVSRIERCKYRNRHTNKIFRSKQIVYIRWRSILSEGYHILKKKGWKRFVGHPYERGRCGIFSFFHTVFFIYFLFVILFPVILFLFYLVSNRN
jgi:hypothetical protein